MDTPQAPARPSIQLPSIATLRATAQSLAMLDAILSPEWEYRYFSFDRFWAPGMEMASMRDGCGDHLFLLFDSAGAALKGFAHEQGRDDTFAAAIQAQVPGEFSAFLTEPAFSMQDATFCYWRRADDATWTKIESGLADDGAADLLSLLVEGPAAYQAWAEDYYEVGIDEQVVAALFEHVPLSDAMILTLNAEAEIGAVDADAIEIGFPRNCPSSSSI